MKRLLVFVLPIGAFLTTMRSWEAQVGGDRAAYVAVALGMVVAWWKLLPRAPRRDWSINVTVEPGVNVRSAVNGLHVISGGRR
jgi:hypothetical protein